MKELYVLEKNIGSDGLSVSGTIGIEESNVKVAISLEYPIEMILQPATKALDKLLDKIEKIIPTDWDKPYIEKLKVEYKQELIKLLTI